MSNKQTFPKIGDRVRLNSTGPVFVVVDVDPKTETASLLPEPEVASVPLTDLRPVAEDGPQLLRPSGRNPRQDIN